MSKQLSLHNFFQRGENSADLFSIEEVNNHDEINEINDLVEHELKNEQQRRERGSYTKYTDEHRAAIGSFAIMNGDAAAVRKYKKIYPNIGESTVRTFKNAVRKRQDALKQQHGTNYDINVHKVYSISRHRFENGTGGRPLLLGKELDDIVISQCVKVREAGGVLDGRVARAVGTAILKVKNPDMLQKIDLGRGWSQSLFTRMGLSIRHATTGKLQMPPGFIKEKTFSFLRDIALPVHDISIHNSMIINWDQTPLKYVPCGQFTMEKTGASKVAIHGLADKKAITAVVTIAADGTFLPLQFIYPGLTERSHPKVQFPEAFSVTHNKSHWSNVQTTLEYIDDILTPYLNTQRQTLDAPDMPALLIYDHFRPHLESSVMDKLGTLNCKCVEVPKNMTDLLQPLDVGVNKPIKDFLRNQFSLWYSEEVGKILESEQIATMEDHASITKILKSSVELRDRHAEWLIKLYDHFQHADQKNLVVNAFKKVGILHFLEKQGLNDDPFSHLNVPNISTST